MLLALLLAAISVDIAMENAHAANPPFPPYPPSIFKPPPPPPGLSPVPPPPSLPAVPHPPKKHPPPPHRKSPPPPKHKPPPRRGSPSPPSPPSPPNPPSPPSLPTFPSPPPNPSPPPQATLIVFLSTNGCANSPQILVDAENFVSQLVNSTSNLPATCDNVGGGSVYSFEVPEPLAAQAVTTTPGGTVGAWATSSGYCGMVILLYLFHSSTISAPDAETVYGCSGATIDVPALCCKK